MLTWLLGGAFLTWGLVRIFAGYPRTPGLLALRPSEAALVGAAADAVFPEGGPVPPSGRQAGVVAYTDRYVAALPGPTRLLIRLLFFLIEHATIFFPAPGWSGARRFSSLSPAQQVAHLDGWQKSRLFPRRLVFASLRAILTMGYFADPRVLRTLSLAPYAIDTPVCEADLIYPRIGERPESIAFTREDLTPPGDPAPLREGDPLHPDYAEPA